MEEVLGGEIVPDQGGEVSVPVGVPERDGPRGGGDGGDLSRRVGEDPRTVVQLEAVVGEGAGHAVSDEEVGVPVPVDVPDREGVGADEDRGEPPGRVDEETGSAVLV